MTKWDRRVNQASERLRGPERLAAVVLPDELHDDDRFCIEALLRAAHNRGCFSTTLRIRLGAELKDLTVSIRDGQPSLAYEAAAQSDRTTGLPLRDGAMTQLEAALSGCPDGKYIGLVLIDIDQFHNLNYSTGLAIGDEGLRETAEALSAALGKDDYLARIGPDEFAVIIPGLRSVSEAFAIAESLRTCIRTTTRNRAITLSAGVSLGDRAQTAAQVMLSADVALRAAKRGGGDRLRALDDKLRAETIRNTTIDERLRAALDNDQLALHYQPVFDSESLRVVGFESLLRIADGGETITTGDLLRAAIDSGLARRVEMTTINLSIEQFRGWQEQALGTEIAFNFGFLPTRDRQSALTLRRILEQSGFDPANLIVEISEGAITRNLAAATESFAILRNAGVRIAIDGFSGNPPMFEVLHTLAPDSIKLQRALVRLTKTERGAAITRAVVSMCGDAGVAVTAVGIETAEQLELLRQMGCTRMQGFLLAPPMPYDLALSFVHSEIASELRDHLQ